MIQRTIEVKIRQKLGKKRVIIVYGPRRAGKTTLTRKLLDEVPKSGQLYLNCDELTTQEALKPSSLSSLERAIGSAKRIVIDEAQRVENIGLTLKLLVDAHPELDIIATGSSSFELANKVKEPLTGRSYEFLLLPLSVGEIKQHFGYNDLQMKPLYERLILLGSYPGIMLEDEQSAKEELLLLADRYVYKDSLELVELRQRQLLPKLLQALALKVGHEVSYNELGQNFGVKLETIERYVTLLEAAFVIYRMPALTGKTKGEVSNRKRKIYFYDLGVRNALIQSLQPLQLRNDLDALWENFCMNERLKWWQSQPSKPQRYYWRGLSGKVDLVEEMDDAWQAFDFSWSSAVNQKLPKYFSETYKKAKHSVVNPENLLDFVT